MSQMTDPEIFQAAGWLVTLVIIGLIFIAFAGDAHDPPHRSRRRHARGVRAESAR